MSDTGSPKLGWIGTGRMGFEIALRLLNAGHELKVWNRTRSKAEPLTQLGATVVDRPSELADCDIVFSIVSSSEVFIDVLLGDDGLLSADGVRTRMVVDSSTISAEASDHVRAEADAIGCAILAAPVSGSPKVVKSGRLGVVVSGPRNAFEEAEPYLKVFGPTVTYVGEGDRARLVKICHNLILGMVIQALAETTVLAEKGGISRADYLEFINGSAMGSMFTRYKAPGMVNLDYTPTFTSHLLRKDFELGLAAARDLDVPLHSSALIHQLLVDVIGRGYGDEDFARLLHTAAEGAGLELVSEDRDVPDGLQPPADDLSSRRPS